MGSEWELNALIEYWSARDGFYREKQRRTGLYDMLTGFGIEPELAARAAFSGMAESYHGLLGCVRGLDAV